MRSMVLVGLLVVGMLAVGLPGIATPASACGFNEEVADVGIARVYLKCTIPHAEVHPNEDPEPP